MKCFKHAPPANEKLLSDVIGERVAKGNLVKSVDELLEALAESPVGLEPDLPEYNIEVVDSVEDTRDSTPNSSSWPATPRKRQASSSQSSSSRKKSRPSRLELAINGATEHLIEAVERQPRTPLQTAVSLVNTDFKSSTSGYRLKLVMKLRTEGNAEIYSTLLKEDRLEMARELVGPAPVWRASKACAKDREDSVLEEEDLEDSEVREDSEDREDRVEEPRTSSEVSEVDSRAVEASKSVEAGKSSREMNILAIVNDMRTVTGI
jgi:hypothetical protein